MKRNSLNFWVDVLTLIDLLGLVVTGATIKWLLPPGQSGGYGMTLWGWGRHDFGDLHLWLGIGFMALVALHLFLHWSWIYCTTARFFGGGSGGFWRRFAAGIVFVIFLAAIIIGSWYWMKNQVKQPDRDYRGPGWRHVN